VHGGPLAHECPEGITHQQHPDRDGQGRAQRGPPAGARAACAARSRRRGGPRPATAWPPPPAGRWRRAAGRATPGPPQRRGGLGQPRAQPDRGPVRALAEGDEAHGREGRAHQGQHRDPARGGRHVHVEAGVEVGQGDGQRGGDGGVGGQTRPLGARSQAVAPQRSGGQHRRRRVERDQQPRRGRAAVEGADHQQQRGRGGGAGLREPRVVRPLEPGREGVQPQSVPQRDPDQRGGSSASP
jgi:hypothetical protein